MRASAILATLIVVTACGPRPVVVRTAPAAPPATTVVVANTLNVPLNVYVVSGSRQLFIGQAASNSTTTMPVQGFAIGSTVTIRAVLADGTRQYDKSNFVLNNRSEWSVP